MDAGQLRDGPGLRSPREQTARLRLSATWYAAWPFVALCVLASSRWLLEGTMPGTASTALSAAAGCLMAAGVAALPLLRRGAARANPLASGWGGWRMAGGAALALCGTGIARSVSDRYVSGNNGTLALCLTTIVVAIAASARGADSDDFAARLWPGLVGVAALLLLLPQPILSGWRFVLALCLMPLLTGLGAAFTWNAAVGSQGSSLRHEAWDNGVAWKVSALLIAALVFGLLGVPTWRESHAPFSFSAAALDGLTFLLSLLALGRLGPMSWASQFLLIPLLAMLEGAVILRPVLDLRSCFACILLAVGTGYLLAVGARDQTRRRAEREPFLA